MNNILKSALLAAAVVAGSSASAAVVVYNPTSVTPSTANIKTEVPLSVDDTVSISETMLPGDTYQYEFTANSAMRISNIALSATGFSFADVSNVEFGFTAVTTGTYTVTDLGAIFAGVGFLPGFKIGAGEKFSIWWEDEGIVLPVTFGASFQTTAVPVPAALPLLIGGIAALGVASRKKRS